MAIKYLLSTCARELPQQYIRLHPTRDLSVSRIMYITYNAVHITNVLGNCGVGCDLLQAAMTVRERQIKSSVIGNNLKCAVSAGATTCEKFSYVAH